MNTAGSGMGPVPPLRYSWQSTVSLALAVTNDQEVFGVTNQGKVVSIAPATGQVRWQNDETYLKHRLTVSGKRLFAFRQNIGLVMITDKGTTFEEKMLISMDPLRESEVISHVIDDAPNNRVYLTKDQALVAISHTGLLWGATAAGPETPHSAFKVGPGRLVTVDGYGFPSLWEFNGTTFKRKWQTTFTGLGAARAERNAILVGNRVVCSQATGIACVQLDTGAVQWRDTRYTGRVFAAGSDTLYVLGHSAHIWAVDLATGAEKWSRSYLYDSTPTPQATMHLAGDVLYVGATITGVDPYLFAVNALTGELVWQANSAQIQFGAGLPCVLADRLVLYGSNARSVSMSVLPQAPAVTGKDIDWTPNPLRGPTSDFRGTLSLTLSRRVTAVAAPWRETSGRGAAIFTSRSLGPGTSSFDWNGGAIGGFSATNQIGKIAVDITEATGVSYTVVKLVPINTLPDILYHWARPNIEVMLYHKHVGGYPDLTFMPGNLVTRAESCAIVTKTLGLSGPTPGFSTKFTDIGAHWAKEAIAALEEREVVGGFLESNGTYTFRPGQNMTRAEQARILVRAYGISPAPTSFVTTFTDIGSHWAIDDIRALEFAKYVTGFREADGSFTYRPSQPLTRAEMCTIVVRIRRLTRP